MATIGTYIEKIREAVYGRDVRESIADAIEQCYYDATHADPPVTNMEVIQARGTYADLNAREDAQDGAIVAERNARQAADADVRVYIDDLNTQRITAEDGIRGLINAEVENRTAADQDLKDTLQTQIDEIIAPSGEAPSAAEVTNARIGADSTVYPTLGDAIRGQVTDLSEAIAENEEAADLHWLAYKNDGKYISSTGVELTSSILAHTDYLLIPENAVSVECGNTTSNAAGTSTYDISPNVLFYDSSKALISYVNATGSDVVDITIPPGAVYCIVNQPSKAAPAGVPLVRFKFAEIKNGFVGEYSGSFGSAGTILQTGIPLKAKKPYVITVNSDITARINLYAHGYTSVMIRAYKKGSYVFISPADSTLDIFNGSYGYTGSISVSVIEQGRVDDVLNKVPIEYVVGSGNAYTSLTALLLALKDDDREKIIYIDGGDYDIFQEYTDLGLLDGEAPAEPTTDYFDYNVWIPRNTHIIGRGLVRLLWEPTTSQISAAWSKTISPVNAAGSMTLENVEIHVKNGRYCIHDDALGKGEYAGARKIYKNVRCYKYESDSGFGLTATIGFGIDSRMYYEFDNCYFYNEIGGSTFYFHDRAADDNGTIAKAFSSNIVAKNCIMDSSGYGVTLYNGATPTTQMIRVDIDSSYIGGTILIADTGSNSTGNNPNRYSLRMLNCNNATVTVRDPNNPYPVVKFGCD